MRRYRAKKKAEERGEEYKEALEEGNEDGVAIRGSIYKEIKRRGLVDALLNDDYEFTQDQAAELIGCDQSSVAKAVAALRQDRKMEEGEEEFEAPDIPDFTLENLDKLTEHFIRFRRENFVTPRVAHDKYSEVPYPTPPHQRKWARAIIRTMVNGSKLMILSPPRHGKLVADSTNVLTTEGWSTHGDLEVGDEVYAPDGSPTEVTHVFPKDVASMEVEFSDGEVFKAHPDHLWRVYDRSRDKWRTMETKEMQDEGLHCGVTKSGSPRNRYMVEYCEPLQNEPVDLPIDPYFLGVWLGDGKSDGLQICGDPADLAEVEIELKERGYEASWETIHSDTGVRYIGFKTEGQGRTSYWTKNLFNNKHIPDIYHTASEEQRRDLLRGLVDSDGHVSAKTGRVRFVNTDERLIEDVVKLVASLGYRPSVTSQEPQLSSSGIQGRQVVYTVQWTPSDGKQQALLTRKDHRHEGLRRRRSVVDVREASDPEPGHCIAVDHPSHQYLIGDKLTPTHNTELLAHLQCWVICCININARILNVGGNEDISSNSSGMTRNMLEENEKLLKFIPDGQVYKPRRMTGKSWTNSKFTVAPRTNPALKSPTMIAVGRMGGIDSRDADFIVVDDLEDHNSTWTETNRQKTRDWWEITVMSRKEAHTGMVVIGSRHHPDDLYQHLLEPGSGWETIVETAHDESVCPVEPPEGEDIWSCNCDLGNVRDHGLEGHEDSCHFHDHTSQQEGGCMLWNDFRDFQWLSEKRGPNFEMVWLNEPVDKGLSIFTRELIDGCKDHRKTGQEPKIEDGYARLIAGLDPSGTQHQAVFLWAYNPKTDDRYAVDFENEKGGGIRKARKQIQTWYEKYGVKWWVIEKDLYHGGIIDDELLKMYRQKNGIHLEPHETGLNKWDPELGVSAIADWMDRGKVHIPWGDHLTAAKWKDYRRQLINFSRERRRNRKSDIVMASWFPEWRMQQWRKDWMADGNKRRRAPAANYPFEPMSDIYERVYA